MQFKNCSETKDGRWDSVAKCRKPCKPGLCKVFRALGKFKNLIYGVVLQIYFVETACHGNFEECVEAK